MVQIFDNHNIISLQLRKFMYEGVDYVSSVPGLTLKIIFMFSTALGYGDTRKKSRFGALFDAC